MQITKMASSKRVKPDEYDNLTSSKLSRYLLPFHGGGGTNPADFLS